MKILTTLAAATLAAALAAPAAAPMSHPKLVGTVGPGFTITLKRNGKPVKTLKAGRYTFVISDRSAIHNFVVEGPRFERALTRVGFVGRKTVTILLRKGKWEFYCAPHESVMHGDLRVT